MKVTVINFSGNVGKTTISRYLLAPRINAPIITVDSGNLDGTEEEVLRGEHFGELQRAAALLNEVIVDVGSSHSEDYLNLMTQYGDSHYDYDYFVIPTISGNPPDPKKLRDTIKTISKLSGMGVEPEKIRLVFNNVRAVDNLRIAFAPLFAYYEDERTFTLNIAATVHVNDIFARVNGTTTTIEGINADTNDYKELMRAATDMDERLRYHDALALKRLAGVVTKELDTVFVELFK